MLSVYVVGTTQKQLKNDGITTIVSAIITTYSSAKVKATDADGALTIQLTNGKP